MSDKTGIQWTDATWNPITGCTKVSAGCDNCYAETLAERFRGTPGHYYENGFDVQLRPVKLDQPLRWTRPRRIFVNSMSDVFHDAVPDEYIAKMWAVMALAPRHTFQVLTKRHGRMRSLVGSERLAAHIYRAVDDLLAQDNPPLRLHEDTIVAALDGFAAGNFAVLPNVWGMVSAEDQRNAERRIPALLDTPFAVRGVSMEPLLGPIELEPDWLPTTCRDCDCEMGCNPPSGGIDWVIVGGESGRGARPMHPDWARSLRDQCQAAGVAYHFKQWGEWAPESGLNRSEGNGRRLHYARTYLRTDGSTAVLGDTGGPGECLERVGKRRAGRELDGRTWDEWPKEAGA
ncbi:MAG: DUF5131 family protein [Mycobacterium sp.]